MEAKYYIIIALYKTAANYWVVFIDKDLNFHLISSLVFYFSIFCVNYTFEKIHMCISTT